jgi:hypothetical protein
MDLTVFEAWLGGIAALTEPQRRRAWRALALFEAAESDNSEPHARPAPLGHHVLARRQTIRSLQQANPIRRRRIFTCTTSMPTMAG